MADSCKVHTNIWSYNVVQHLCYTMQACHGRIHFLWGHIVHITSTDKAFHHDNIPSATDTRKLFSTFKSLLIPSPLPPATSLTTDTFAAFFTDKVAAINSQFSDLPTQTLLHSFFIWTSLNLLLLVFHLPLSQRTRFLSFLQTGSHSISCPLDPILSSPSFYRAQLLLDPCDSNHTCGQCFTDYGYISSPPSNKLTYHCCSKTLCSLPFVDNYGPVSFLSSLNILNKLSSKRSQNFSQHNLFDSEQPGFKSGHST